MFTVRWSTDSRTHRICTNDGYTVQDLFSTYRYCNFHVYWDGIELDPERALALKENKFS